jgi:hypothetical protein
MLLAAEAILAMARLAHAPSMLKKSEKVETFRHGGPDLHWYFKIYEVDESSTLENEKRIS